MTAPNDSAAGIALTQAAWSPAYQVISIDLAVARTAEPVVPVGQLYDAVYIVELPLGATIELAFGANRDFIPFTAAQQGYEFSDKGCPRSVTEGLFVRNGAAGGICRIVVSYGGLGGTF